MQQRRGERLLVQAELRADARGPDGMLDEVGTGVALLTFVRGGREPERPGHDLRVDPAAVLRYLREQLVEEALVLLSCRDYRHCFSVYSGPPRPYLRGQERPFPDRNVAFCAQAPPERRPQGREARTRTRLARRAGTQQPPGACHAAKLSLGR